MIYFPNLKFLIIIFFFFSTTLYSQIEIKGVVKDSTSSVEFANIILQNSESGIIAGAITDSSGAFRLLIEPGGYIFKIKYIGYKECQKILNISNDIDLGVINIRETTNELEEVVLSTKKHVLIRKNDRLIFNIENTTTSDSGTAMDVLGVTPGLLLNNDVISMFGKSSMRVMVDGRLIPFAGNELSSYLNSLPSNSIKSIEVITTPPSKYNSEGNAGLINIILKKNKNDFWNSNIRLGGTQRLKASWDSGITLNYKKDKFSFSGNIGKGNFNKRNVYRNSIFYPEEIWEGEGYGDYLYEYLNSSIAIDYQLQNFWTTGFTYSNTISDVQDDAFNLDNILGLNKELLFSIDSRGNGENDSGTHSLTFFNVFELDSLGKKISIDLDFYKANSVKSGRNSGYQQEKNDAAVQEFIFANQTNIDYDFKNYAARIDVEIPLKDINIEIGASASLSETLNQFEFYNELSGETIFDPNQSNKFKYDEDILAAYISSDTKLTQKWSAKAGLRIENTRTTSFSESLTQENKNDYVKLFPTIYSTYQFNEKHSLSANYSKRVNRPRFDALDPFQIILNPYKIVQGNPFLQPSFSNNYELIFNSNKNEFKGYFQSITGGYEQVGEIDPFSKIVNYNYINYLDIQNFGITDTYIFDYFKWLTSYNTVDIGYSIFQSSLSGTIKEQRGFNAFMQTRNDISLNNKNSVLLGINYFYVFPAKVNISQAEGYGSMNLSLKLRLFQRKLNLAFFFNDVLDSSRRLVKSSFNDVENTYRNYYDTRSIRVSLSYSFGNNKLTVRARGAGNQEIQNRAEN